MAKTKFYCVLYGRKTGVFLSWDEVKEHIHKYPDASYKGFPTEQEAWDYFYANYKTVQAETNAKRHVRYVAAGKSKLKVVKQPPLALSFKKQILACHLGGKDSDTTISSNCGETITVPLTQGATRQRKALELIYSALQWAERSINLDTNLVEIWGVDIHAINTLTDWAPASRERSWLNASGKPFANRDVIEPMLTLFEALRDKVKLHSGEQPVDDDAPF